MPGGERDVGRRLDRLITVAAVREAETTACSITRAP